MNKKNFLLRIDDYFFSDTKFFYPLLSSERSNAYKNADYIISAGSKFSVGFAPSLNLKFKPTQIVMRYSLLVLQNSIVHFPYIQSTIMQAYTRLLYEGDKDKCRHVDIRSTLVLVEFSLIDNFGTTM